MKFVLVCVALMMCLCVSSAGAQQHTLLLWPNGNPEPSKVIGPEMDPTLEKDRMVAGKPVTRVTNVSKPNATVYLADAAKNTGVAVVVLPGGGYDHLAITQEGTEVCAWLNSLGVNCVLVKYRVPEKGHYPENVEDLEDAQQAMRLTRQHAQEWHIDPKRVGVIGFSAGGHLAVALSTHPEFQGNVPASTIDARPDFQMVIYAGGLLGADGKLNTALEPNAHVPPSFLVQAEDDNAAHVETSLVYYQALKDAKVPAELHLYAEGGHGFGLRRTEHPVSRWPARAEEWLSTIGVLSAPTASTRP